MSDLSKLPNSKLLEEIKERGFFVSKVPPQTSGKVFKFDVAPMVGRKYRFGIISCTHLGSMHQQLTHLYSFYTYCKQAGVKMVLHCGDIIEGEKIFRGQEYTVFAHGAKAQVDYAVDNYPRVEGIATKVIMGNHDESFFVHSGANVVEDIARRRDDIEYLGDYLAFVKIDSITVGLMHSAGGVAYSRSYKVQKIIEQLAPEMKPNILAIGHWHINCLIPAYRNVEGISIGCFKSVDPYLTRMGLFPNVGGVVVEVEVDDKGLVGVKYDFRHFYNMKKKDY